MLGWARCDFHNKHAKTHYVELVFLHLVRSAAHILHFSVSKVWIINILLFMLGWDWYRFHKMCVGICYIELVFFSSGRIYGSRSAFRCVRGTKCQRTIFMLEWVWCGFHKKRVRTRYAELIFLYPVRSKGHIVHFGASGTRNVKTQFFMLGQLQRHEETGKML
jgi:hypothetical protein